jgi:hypothetical protein
MDLHPYDGVERRFHHSDGDPTMGLAIVTSLLGLSEQPPSAGLLYDLSIYSGGIGVLDRFAISLPANPAIWAQAAANLNGLTPEQAVQDVAWVDDFQWLIIGEEPALPAWNAAQRFINSKRQSFQEECRSDHRILFGNGSTVNDWIVIWGDDAHMNYLGYSQG